MRGSDLRGHGITDAVRLDDKTVVPLCFCFLTFSLAEDTYNDIFKRDGDILEIMNVLSADNAAALLSLGYGAAAAIDEKIRFEDFVPLFKPDSPRNKLLDALVGNISKMFRPKTGWSGEPDDNKKITEFPWDIYYRNALYLGMSEEEFWAATPRKMWLLTRDKEKEEESKRLNELYL